MKKLFSSAIVLLLLCSFSVTAFAIDFYDINNVPWEGAKDYIISVSDLSLMVGDTDNYGRRVFRAKDPVTCCETAQLIYSVLKSANIAEETSEAVILDWAAVLNSYNIPEWARPAVGYCLEEGIISSSELGIFMTGEKQNPATRETVALFFGRALSYLATSLPELTFNDTDNISFEAIPSLRVLYSLNVMIGDDNNNFNPKNNINRAEMAVVTSKSYNLANGSGIPDDKGETGTVTSMVSLDTAYMLTVEINGEKKIFLGDNSVSVTKNGKDINFSDIKTGDEISISYSNSVINSITVKSSTNTSTVSSASEITGEVTALNKSAIKIAGKSTYSFDADDIDIKIYDGEDTITDIYDFIDVFNDNKIIEATVYMDNSSYVTDINGYVTYACGNVVSFDPDGLSLLLDTENGKNTYDFKSNTEIYFEGSEISFSTFENYVARYNVKAELTIDSRCITRIDIVSMS